MAQITKTKTSKNSQTKKHAQGKGKGNNHQAERQPTDQEKVFVSHLSGPYI
jgi:hypothetical protein